MNISKQGTLYKWTNYLYGWKKRYFVLHDNLFEYCKQQGRPLKGKISLQTLDIKKHPKKQAELIIDTGVNTMHLRAADQKEAQEWYFALKKAKEGVQHNPEPILSPKCTDNSLTQKVSELWKVFGLITEGLEKIPDIVKISLAEVKDVIGLCACFKDLASETLSLLEMEKSKPTKNQKLSELRRGSVDTLNGAGMVSPKGYCAEEEFKDDESVEFQDAQSHESREVEDYYCPHRKCLPYLRNPNQKYNIWKVVKDSIGKDLSKLAVPVYYNEPISLLQRFTEDLTYHEAILNGCEYEDPCLRLAYIACFGVSSYVSTQQRTMKPFNPILGETFEMVRDGYRAISEQVSHHPPVSAIHCEHEKFLFRGSVNIKTSFKGTYLNCVPIGTFHLMLKQTGDHIVWTKPQTNAHNIIFGKMYIDHYGKMELKNLATGDRAELNFHKKGWFEKVSTAVDGFIHNHQGIQKYKVFGNWNEKMSIQDLSTNKTIVVWEKYPYPENYDHNYWFSDFAIQLNLPPEHFPNLPPTDSRQRPDQRSLENGDLKTAVSEKLRVEEKQREARKFLENSGNEYKPKWFSKDKDEWVYAGGYWEAKENESYNEWPDIF